MGALPETEDPRSPALPAQTPALAGGAKTFPVPTTSAPGSALSAPSPGGSAKGASAPLSQAGQPESQGGAGNSQAKDPDLIRDRGTPEEYWAGNVKELGSAKSAELMAQAIEGSARTGKMGEVSEEDYRRSGVRTNEALNIGTEEQQNEAIEGLVYKPYVTQTKAEIDKGIIEQEDGVVRVAQTMANVEGADNEDELREIVVTAKRRATGNDKAKLDTEGEDRNLWGRMKNWWQLGKDDPTTEAREDETVEVTRFMGGMTRQQLGMFVFQWGALMMANADKGFGAAMGNANLGAMAGHQQRGVDAAALETASKQQEFDNTIKQQQADAQTMTAEAARDRANVAGVGYQGKDAYLAQRFKAEGMTDSEINAILRGVEGTEVRAQKLQDSLNKMIEGAGFTDVTQVGGASVKVRQMTGAQQKQWIVERLKSAAEAAEEYDKLQKRGGALPDPTPTPNTGGALPAAPDAVGNALNRYGDQATQ